MAIKFQHNKTFLQQLEKQLKVRVRTPPYRPRAMRGLRMEVKRCKEEAAELEERLETQISSYEHMHALLETRLTPTGKCERCIWVSKIAGVQPKR